MNPNSLTVPSGSITCSIPVSDTPFTVPVKYVSSDLPSGLPDMTGFEVCQKIRDISGTPIIFLSGLADIKNRISSFQAGGDDFLAKPYDIIELELRIEARIRKNEQVFFSDIMRFGDLCIDENRRMITYKERPGEFSALQFDIIAFMARNPGKVFSYEQIYDRIWKEPILKSRHNLQVAVATVRQKMARLCDGRQYIRTLARKGYYFTPDETREDKTN